MDILGRNHYLATLELYGEIAEIFHQCSTELPEQIDGLLEILDETVRQAYNLRLKEGLDVPELPSLSRKKLFSILYSLSSVLHFLEISFNKLGSSKELNVLLEICLQLFKLHNSSSHSDVRLEDENKWLFLATRIYDILLSMLSNLKDSDAKHLVINCMWKCLESIVDSITSNDNPEKKDDSDSIYQLCYVVEFLVRISKVEPVLNLTCISSIECTVVKLLGWEKFSAVCKSYDLESHLNLGGTDNALSIRSIIMEVLFGILSSVFKFLLSIGVTTQIAKPPAGEETIKCALTTGDNLETSLERIFSFLTKSCPFPDGGTFDDDSLCAMKCVILAGVYMKSTEVTESIVRNILKSIEDFVNTRSIRLKDSFYPDAIECLDIHYNASKNDQLKVRTCFVIGNFLFSAASATLFKSLPPKQILSMVIRASSMLIKEGMLESMASGRIVHYMHKRATKMTQAPISRDAAIVYVNATIGLILASKYLPGNMIRSIYDVARKFDSPDRASPLHYVYIFIPFYILVAPRTFLADFIGVTLSCHSLLINQVYAIFKLLNMRSVVSHSRCITLLQAAFEEFRDRRIAFQGNCVDFENANSIDFLVGLVKYCNIIMGIIIENYGGVRDCSIMKVILGLKRVWIAASDVLLTSSGEWNPAYKSLMEQFDTNRTLLIKNAGLFIYDPNNSDVSVVELRKGEVKELEMRNALANVLQSNTASCEEIMNMDIYTVIAILEVYLVESMSIRRYGCCHLEDMINLFDSSNQELSDTATCDLLFRALTKIFVRRKGDDSKNRLRDYLTDLISYFMLSSENVRSYLLHAITQTLKSAPFLYWDDKNMFMCFDVMSHLHRDVQVKRPVKIFRNSHMQGSEDLLFSLAENSKFVDMFTKMVHNWISVSTSLSLHETARSIERYMFSHKFNAKKVFKHSRGNQDFIRLLMSLNISTPLVKLILEHRGSNDMEIGRFIGVAEAQTKAGMYDSLESCLNAKAKEVVSELRDCLFSTSSTPCFKKIKNLACDAANLIIMGYRDECLLHLLYSIPITYFNTTVIKLCESLWHSIITYNPSHRTKVVLQIITLWRRTSVCKLGIYSSARRHTKAKCGKRKQSDLSADSFTHMILLKFLLELFTYDSYNLPMLMVYGDFVIDSLEKLSLSGVEHSASRDVYMNLIIFGINVVELLSPIEPSSALIYAHKLMVATISLYEISRFPSVVEKEHLDTATSLHMLLKYFDVDYISKCVSECTSLYPHDSYVKSVFTSKRLNDMKRTALLLLESEISQKQVWLDPLGTSGRRRVTLEKLNAASRRDFIKISVMCLAEINPRVILYMKSYIKNLPDSYYNALERICTLAAYSVIDTSEYPNVLLKLLNKTEVDVEHRLIMYSMRLSTSRVLYWLNSITKYNPWVLQYLIRILRNSSIRTLLFYVPQLVQSLRFDKYGYVEETIIKLACNSEYFAHQILWSMSASMSTGQPDWFTLILRRVQDKIISQFSDLEKKFYDIEFSLFNNITDISRKLMPLVEYRASNSAKKKKIDDELAKIVVPPGAYLPINPKYTVVEIDNTSGKPLQSHSKAPFIVTFKISENADFLKDGRTPQNTQDAKKSNTMDVYSIFKAGDDCRQDQLALQLITLFKQIFTIEGLDLYVYPYKVVATSPKCGIIEVIPSSISRDIIGREKINSLYGWFVAEFGGTGSKKFSNACIEFTKSMAAYSVILYLLQIKDRHNGNIMIDKNGRIIHIGEAQADRGAKHILRTGVYYFYTLTFPSNLRNNLTDFGFMISTAPGGGILESSPFKLTSDMIRIMDTDERSPLYTMFKELCVKAFLAARIHANEIVDVTYVMKNSGLPCFRGKDSIRNLEERFALDKTDQQAAEIMLNCIKTSYANTRSNLYDKFQYLQNGIPY